MNTITISFDLGIDLHIKLNQNRFVRRWANLLAEELETKEILQTDTFSCFFTEDQSRQYLIDAIITVNNFLKTTFIDIPSENNFLDPEYYNQLHEKFEKLSGPDWDQPTRLMVIAPKEVQLAIRHINRFCHRLEEKPYKIEPLLRVEFDSSRREPLLDDDYELFVPMKENNCVYLDYSTLGKSLYECYQDGLDPDYAGLKIQNHYCANFILKFENSKQRRPPEDFLLWLSKYNYEYNKIKNYGHIPLGYIVEKNLLQSIVNCRKINKITLE
jgi:hypothetical protein